MFGPGGIWKILTTGNYKFPHLKCFVEEIGPNPEGNIFFLRSSTMGYRCVRIRLAVPSGQSGTSCKLAEVIFGLQISNNLGIRQILTSQQRDIQPIPYPSQSPGEVAVAMQGISEGRKHSSFAFPKSL